LGSLPWNAALAFAGFYLGANWHNIISTYYSVVAAVLLVLAIIIRVPVLRLQASQAPSTSETGQSVAMSTGKDNSQLRVFMIKGEARYAILHGFIIVF
jgi:hypothetical protein